MNWPEILKLLDHQKKLEARIVHINDRKITQARKSRRIDRYARMLVRIDEILRRDTDLNSNRERHP